MNSALRWRPLLALMGCLDVGTIAATGNLPNPEFATVVSSAFGAVTLLLAGAFLKEPIAPAQLAGMVLIFGGVGARRPLARQPTASSRPSRSSAANSSSDSTIFTAATFSSRWATFEVPGMGSMTGLRFSTQASAIWLGGAL